MMQHVLFVPQAKPDLEEGRQTPPRLIHFHAGHWQLLPTHLNASLNVRRTAVCLSWISPPAVYSRRSAFASTSLSIYARPLSSVLLVTLKSVYITACPLRNLWDLLIIPPG